MCQAYRDAGDAAIARMQSPDYIGFIILPCIFLYFRSIELALKSVLVAHGIPEKELTKTLGHRLSRLLKDAEKHINLADIGISPTDRELLDRFSNDYADKWFEYPDRFWKQRPKHEALKQLTDRVCTKVRQYRPPKQ